MFTVPFFQLFDVFGNFQKKMLTGKKKVTPVTLAGIHFLSTVTDLEKHPDSL